MSDYIVFSIYSLLRLEKIPHKWELDKQKDACIMLYARITVRNSSIYPLYYYDTMISTLNKVMQ